MWILGAGASYASGIPLGSELVDRWLTEIQLKEEGGKIPLEEWATAENLGIDGFKYEDRASFYPKLYQRRFRQNPEEGYAYLEDVMSGKDPSPGYSILAAALAADPPRHNAIITTNFDNLVADALSIYTDTFPFVCGHESLVPFVRVAMRRPLGCKIHRDLLLVLLGERMGIALLDEEIGRRAGQRTKRYRDRIQGLDTVELRYRPCVCPRESLRRGLWLVLCLGRGDSRRREGS